MQIKLGTLQWFYPKVYGKEVSQMEALAITQDLEQAKRFFVDCAVKVEGCVWYWSTAEKHKAYFEVVIPLIRVLEN